MVRSPSLIQTRACGVGSVSVVIFSVQTVAENAEEKIEGNVYLTRPDNFDQLRTLFRRLSQPPRTN